MVKKDRAPSKQKVSSARQKSQAIATDSTPPKPGFWILKTEPTAYSIHQLMKDKKTNWNGIRNYQAQNNLKKTSVGDMALIYHTGDEKAAVGLAKVSRSAYPESSSERWVQIDIEAVETFAQPVPLSLMRNRKDLADLPILRQSRLSVSPATQSQFETLVNLGRGKEAE